MSSLILYEHPLSPYAQKCKIALYEKGVDFTLRTPTAIGTGQVDNGFLAASPRGEVPALVHGDFSVFDSTVILEYIEDSFPTPPLLPKEPKLRAKARMIVLGFFRSEYLLICRIKGLGGSCRSGRTRYAGEIPLAVINTRSGLAR